MPRPATPRQQRPIRRANMPTTSPIPTGIHRSFRCSIPAASYLPFGVFPGPVGSGVNAFNFPYVATLLLNYKHDRFTVTPSFQFRCGKSLRRAAHDARRRSGGRLRQAADEFDYRRPALPLRCRRRAPFDANNSSCAATLSIPDPYTGQFDGIGAFREPAQLLGHLQLAYDALAARHAFGDAGQPVADLLRRTADALHLFLEQPDVHVHKSHRRTDIAAGRQRVQSRRERANVPAVSLRAVLWYL